MKPDPRHQTQLWAIVPAAGAGSRMNSDTPKQYLTIGDKTVIEHTLQRLAAVDGLSGIVVALSAADDRWPALRALPDTRIETVAGGAERHLSVYNALCHLGRFAVEQDWVLVHDAARPCVRVDDINKLIVQVRDHEQGGLLASPVRDTMKRCDSSGHVAQTVDREGLWHALTPQMFRLGELTMALKSAIDNNQNVTDDASAMELAGFRPLLVAGHADNIKITRRSGRGG